MAGSLSGGRHWRRNILRLRKQCKITFGVPYSDLASGIAKGAMLLIKVIVCMANIDTGNAFYVDASCKSSIVMLEFMFTRV